MLSRKGIADLFQKPLLFLRQVYPIRFIPVLDVDAASGSFRGIDGVMQRKALYVIFDCAPAHAELESEILYLVVSPDTDRFPDGAASLKSFKLFYGNSVTVKYAENLHI